MDIGGIGNIGGIDSDFGGIQQAIQGQIDIGKIPWSEQLGAAGYTPPGGGVSSPIASPVTPGGAGVPGGAPSPLPPGGYAPEPQVYTPHTGATGKVGKRVPTGGGVAMDMPDRNILARPDLQRAPEINMLPMHHPGNRGAPQIAPSPIAQALRAGG